MLRILGSMNPFGHGVNRRTAMSVGALGAISLNLPDLLYHESLADGLPSADSTFGCAKRILLVYLQGAASQFETWDPKPDAAEGIRGKWGATQTSVPGTLIGERLPKLAVLADRFSIVRSMTHSNNNHSNLYTLTGYPASDFSSETNPFDNRHHPFFGSVLDYLEDQNNPTAARELPRNMGLPFRFSTYSPFTRRSGPYGAFLGHGYNPVWTEFDGKATRTANRVSFFRRLAGVDVQDPYLGITPESRLRVSKAVQLQGGLTLDRLDKRRTLLQQFDEEQRRVGGSKRARSLDRFQEMAFSLITSEKLRNALDVGRESMALREQYGMTLFGQSALTARRLLEAGCPLVSVFWDEYKVVNTAWDTHFNHFTRMGDELLPGFDSGMSSLLKDLEDRGLLHDTLVMCLTEHGRTPKINNLDRGGGRGHWSQAYSVMLAGAGIRPGTVVGASDSTGAFVHDRPVSPEDILATMYHLKGIAGDTTIPDRFGRPVRLTERGTVIRELL
jgi:Protein of unknown function (DUF1501)